MGLPFTVNGTWLEHWEQSMLEMPQIECRGDILHGVHWYGILLEAVDSFFGASSWSNRMFQVVVEVVVDKGNPPH